MSQLLPGLTQLILNKDSQSLASRLHPQEYNSLRRKMEIESGVPWPESSPSELCSAANSP
ncbi:hypothetical protein APTSU1_001334700 [Apodemus speciosus]|uniref:Uncharacterized protein n=1 Tax=Apodemus speciosus TaxID=105296 RepID=A0ABQ0FFZ6_APOSI